MHIRRFLHRIRQKDDRLSWSEHRAMIRAASRWEQDLEQFPVLPSTNGDVTAYVANFHRPQNIALIVRSLLACPSINRIIVSNNNPASHLARWFHPSSDHVTILQHDTAQSCSMRHVHLNAFPSPFYLIIDDDLFLLPNQIEGVLKELRADPSRPHGLFGQQRDGEGFRMGMQRLNQDIDVISRMYAFTAAHHENFFRVAAEAGMPEGHPDWSLSSFDDVILSFTGTKKPRMHDVGPLVDCPSQGAKSVATWRTNGFFERRDSVYRQLSDRHQFNP